MGEVIGVVSLKGGVGKTSTVAALGAAIADFGKKVLLIDANFSAPNLGLHLNVINPEKTLHHVLAREANLREAVHNLEHFDLLPADLFNRKQINFMALRDKVRYLKKKYDYVLIDSSPSLGEETLAAMLASDGLLVVTTPDYSTLGTTLKAIKLAKNRGTPIHGLVLNKVHGKSFEIPLSEIEETSDVPVLAVVPHSVKVLEAQSKFSPSTHYDPNSEGSEEYKKLAASLLGEKYKKPVRLRNFFRWVNPRKQDVNRIVFYNRQTE